MNMSKVIIVIVGVLVFILGLKLENEIIIIIGGGVVATGILFVLSAIAGYGKSQKEKEQIEKEIFDQFNEGISRRSRYDLNKLMMNDQINKDIQENIVKGINRSSKNK